MVQWQALNQLAFDWFLAMANITAAGSILLAGTLIFSHLAAKGSAGLKFLVVLSGLCGLAAMPLLAQLSGVVRSFPMIRVENSSEMAFEADAEVTDPGAEVPELQSPTVDVPIKQVKISVYGWLFFGWAAGVSLRGAVILVGLMRMYRNLRRILPLENVGGKALLGLKLRVAVHPAFATPVTCGLFRPIILVPSGFWQDSARQQQAILCHEAAHIRRWDNLTNLLAQIVVALYWFNPLVWLVLGQLRVLREKACDDYVLGTGIKPSDYAQVLLGELQKGWKAPQQVMMSNFNSKGVNRLKYILDSKVKHQPVSAKKRALFLIGLGIAMIPIAGLQLFAAVDSGERTEVVVNQDLTRTTSSGNPLPAVLPLGTAQPVSAQAARVGSESLDAVGQQQNDSERVKQEILDWQGNHGAVLGTGEYVLPTQGRITATFGYRINPVSQKMGFHGGIDIAAPQGTEIVAADSGQVISAGHKGGYGNTVIIDHGGNIATVYAHTAAFSVTAGQKVTKGERIAWVGSTGMSTGPHLHFQVRKNGVAQDPVILIPKLATLPITKKKEEKLENRESIKAHITLEGDLAKVEFVNGGLPCLFFGYINDTPLGQPVPGYREIVYAHGYGVGPYDQKPLFHHGTDIKCPIGTPVLATADGTVVRAEFGTDGGGNRVVIQHTNFRTGYFKLSEIKVQVGQYIKKGDLIGYSGMTGKVWAADPHLHYEIRKYGWSLDARPFLDAGEKIN